MTTPRARRRIALFAALAATVVIALVLAGFRFDWIGAPKYEAYTNHGIGANADVTGTKVPTTLTATTLTDVVPPVTAVNGLGPMVQVEPGGPLPAPITLRFRLDRPAAPGAWVFVASRDKPGDEWQYQQVAVETTADGHYVSIERTHLSDFWPFDIDFGKLLRDVKQEVIDALLGDVTQQAKKPSCKNEQAARGDGYKIESNGKAALYWCFGIENIDGKDQRMVRLVNRLHYPIRVTHPGFAKPKDSRYWPTFQVEFQQLARIGSGKEDVLFPFDTITYTTNLGHDEGAKAITEYDGWAQHLHRLDIIVSTLSLIVTKLGGKAISKKAKDRWKLLDDTLEKTDCFNAVMDRNLGGSITKCFNPQWLKDIFDWKGILLAPLVAGGALINWLHSEFTSLFDQFNDRSKYAVLVTRPKPPSKFIGKWTVHGSTVEFKKDGTGLIVQNEGPCNYTHMCNSYAKLRWQLEGDSKLTYTITSYEERDETGTPAFDIGTAGDVVGQWFSVVSAAPGLLRRTARNAEWQPSNPYLCGKGISEANKAQCGA